ncbi:hypothetical protein PQQ72_24075 [Paraburkholderia strydomiana]|uniref:ApyA family aminopyruvatide-related RiPP n=1 Tax=Paraburkholderia strydomiana TaxID=1245417 RepID=UPI0038BC9BB2
MANGKNEERRFTLSGRQVLDFELLDEESKQAVIKCIQEKGRISVIINEVGRIGPGAEEPGFRQLID